MMPDEEFEYRTKNHKTRLARVTLYLEVPTQNDMGIVKGEDDTLSSIETILANKGYIPTGPGDINLSPIFDDDVFSYKRPVGYLAPDGKFYVIEEEENGLAHLEVSRVVYNKYIKTPYIQTNRLGGCFEDTLEKNGFIKVHVQDIRYMAHMYLGKNSITGEENYSPDPTPEQIRALIEYCEHFNLDGINFINEKYFDMKILRDGDPLSIRKLFQIWM